MRGRLLILMITVSFLAVFSSCTTRVVTLSPPSDNYNIKLYTIDGNLTLDILSPDDSLIMSVDHLGLMIDSIDFSQGWKLKHYSKTRVNRRWTQPWGENKKMEECYNGMTLDLVHTDGIQMALEIRAFDDGLGFRYRYTLPHAPQHLLQGETTQFVFPREATAWSIPANFESYEFAYRELPLSQTTDANTPFTIRMSDSLYVSIHEASLLQMPEMTLVQRDSLRFGVWLAPGADSTVGFATPIVGTDTITTSFRTITLGRQAIDLINSSLILNLNEPCVIDDVSWIRPMKYIGMWWGMHLGINSWTPDARHGATTINALRYVDFAAQHHIDAVLIEGWNTGWEQWGDSQQFSFTESAPDMDIDSVIRYAHQRGVEIIIHHETGGNIPHYEKQMEKAYQWCQERHIHTLKTGYAGGFPNREIHHSLYGVQHYTHVMQKTATHQLMLDVHEPIKPTGLRRTYPNLMTAEGARGMEWNAWSDGNPPSHQCILPFTRLLAGPMDYTPGIFDLTYQRIQHNPNLRQWNQKDARECRVPSTIAHQVALWTVIYSPLIMASDLIENYEGNPMFQFFEDYNPDIDWSSALQGEIGQYVVIARRSGSTYYVGAITNEEPRNISLPLSFLPANHTFKATIYADGLNAHYLNNPTDYSITHQYVVHNDTLSIQLAPGGGCAIEIKE